MSKRSTYLKTLWSPYLGEWRPFHDIRVKQENVNCTFNGNAIYSFNPICPEEIILSDISTSTGDYSEYEGSYDRIYSYSGGSFTGGYYRTGTLQFTSGNDSDGNLYSVFGKQSGTDYFTIIGVSINPSSAVTRYNIYKSTGGYFPLAGSLVEVFTISAINYEISGGVRYPERGYNTYTTIGFTGNTVVSYPQVCPPSP